VAASRKLGTRARVQVAGTINGFPIRTSAFPMGGNTHMILVNKEMQKTAQIGAGNRVKVVIEVDEKPRVLTIPPDFKGALTKSPASRDAFEKMSYSHKREYVRWIEKAKKEETRARRIEKVVEMLKDKAGKSP
jgi:hypothetical protein